MDLTPLIVPTIGVIATAITGIITIYVARKKGLPDINREIESRMVILNRTLDEQLETANNKIDSLMEDFHACKTDLTEALNDNKRLYRRLRFAEGDLRDLYKGQGQKIPERLASLEEEGNGD